MHFYEGLDGYWVVFVAIIDNFDRFRAIFGIFWDESSVILEWNWTMLESTRVILG